MQTATIVRGNKTAHIKQNKVDLAYYVQVVQTSDISDYGDILCYKVFKTAKRALNFANKELI